MGLFSKLTDSLSKTRKGFVEKIFDAFTGKEIDDDLYDELEELLIQGDVGVNTCCRTGGTAAGTGKTGQTEICGTAERCSGR